MFSKQLLALALSLSVVAIFCLPIIAGAQTPSAQPSAAGEKDPAKIYELRIYKTVPGKLPELHARFRDHTMKLFEKHGMENVIYWTLTEDFREETKDNTLVYLLAHKSKEAADASWAAFRADPDWQAVVAKSEANGKLNESVVSVFLNPTDFNPSLWEANAKSDKPARLFELRRYGGGADSHVGRFRDWEAELFRTSGIETLGFWSTADNTAFVYLLGHKDRETATANWQTFSAGFRGRGGAGGGRGRGNPNPEVREEAPAQQPATTQSNAATQPGEPAPAGGARRRGRGGAGGGTEIRWLVPTDYSPRK